jgi:alanine dehydrogenase
VTPAGVHTLVLAGHTVLVEQGAGAGSGFSDAEYSEAGGQVVPSHAEPYQESDMVVKVKEPLPSEYGLLRDGVILFTYLHLAESKELTETLLDRRVTGIAFETVQLLDGTLPLLTPMSEVAGRMSIQIAAHYLESKNGGRGKLLGGVPGVNPANVVIIGAGAVGTNAAKVALGMGANVTLVDRNLERLRHLDDLLHGRLTTLASTRYNIAEALVGADVLVGAVLIAGAKAPILVTRDMVRSMGPGAVVIDVAVDQSGCIETTHPTTHSHPTYLVDGVVHYGVTNIPGAVPRTSTIALANATLPYVVEIANRGLLGAVSRDLALARGVNTYDGQITYPAVADAFSMSYKPLNTLMPIQQN